MFAWVSLVARGACCFLDSVFQPHYRVVNGEMPDLRTWSPSAGSRRYSRPRFITRVMTWGSWRYIINSSFRPDIAICLTFIALIDSFAVCFLENSNCQCEGRICLVVLSCMSERQFSKNCRHLHEETTGGFVSFGHVLSAVFCFLRRHLGRTPWRVRSG